MTAEPTPTPVSGEAFMHSVEPDAYQYPTRYYPPGGEFSVEVPADWIFQQRGDSGLEFADVSEQYGGKPVAAFYILPKTAKNATAQQAVEILLGSQWLADRDVESRAQSDFIADSGVVGWLVQGTMAVEKDGENREDGTIIGFVRDGKAFFLAAFPDRAGASLPFWLRFDAMARSFRWEETTTLSADLSNGVQLLGGDGETLDPALTRDGTGGAIGDIYSGLVAFDTSLSLRPGLAESWDITPDGKTYTFHLRRNARFHNNRPFTADDVLFSWLRAAGPDLNSETALYYLGDIAGLKEYRKGTAESITGIRVVDPYTLQVTLDADKPFFPAKLTRPATWIVDRYTVRIPGWELHPNGTGPFRVVQSLPKKSLLLEANPNYYDAPPRISHVMYWYNASAPDDLYKGGKIDRMEVVPGQLPAVNDPHDPLFGTVFTEQRMCTEFIRFNAAEAPFDDPAVRKAFALSVDRSLYTEVSAPLGDLPGAGLLPVGMPGYSSDPVYAVFDTQEAGRSIARSHYFDGSAEPPEIGLPVQGDGAQYDPTMEFLVRSWEKALGISILVEGRPEEDFREHQQADPAGLLILSSHCAEYPDPENFYSILLHGDFADYHYGYRNASLDDLLDRAAVEPDWNRRIELYRRADRILYGDAPLMVLSYSGPRYVVWRQNVMGFVPSPIDVPQHQWLWISNN